MSRRDISVEIFAAGDGVNYPKPGHTVSVHYTGYLKDGRRCISMAWGKVVIMQL